jgi:hypothetical protein
LRPKGIPVAAGCLASVVSSRGTEGSNPVPSSGESGAKLTSNDIDDGSQVGPLLEQTAGPVALFTGDGAYDRDDVYREDGT